MWPVQAALAARGCLSLLLFFAVPAMPQLLPERIGDNKLVTQTPAPPPDPPVWSELGLEDSGLGTYEGAAGRYTLTLYRLQDSTAALAAFEWQRPPDARPIPLAPLAAESRGGTSAGSLTVGTGNYLVIWNGHKPSPEEFNALLLTIPKYQHSGLPALPRFFPSTGLRPNSERYVIGPASLARFYPEISPSVAAFHLSAEAQTAVFGKDGGIRLAVFAYPTFEIARKQALRVRQNTREDDRQADRSPGGGYSTSDRSRRGRASPCAGALPG